MTIIMLKEFQEFINELITILTRSIGDGYSKLSNGL